MLARILTAVVIAAAACSGGDDATHVDISHIGDPCPDDICPEGLMCLHYFGLAGPLQTCEFGCDEVTCPDGTACVNILDGPGEVCRPE